MKPDKEVAIQREINLGSVLAWINEHNDTTFNGTIFHGTSALNCFIVSDYQPSEIFLDCEEEGLNEWSDCEGWQITSNVCGCWICRNDSGRFIFISE